MSYCRFSSDDWHSDVYCYEDVGGGYTTHVAGLRVVGDVPPLPPWPDKNDDETMKVWGKQMFDAHRAQMAFLETAVHAPIGLPHDGESFNDPDLPAFLARLLQLQALGYHVPAGAIEAVRNELADAANEPKGN